MARVLHLLSQRPGRTGSGVTLEALANAAHRAGWEQHAIVGVPADATPRFGSLPAEAVHPLRFETTALPFPVPGMSDVMPYPSTRFRDLDAVGIARYESAFRDHIARVVDAVQPDLVHAHHVWLASATVKDVAPELPVVTHCHGTGLRQMALCPHLADRVRDGCRRNDHFLALTGAHIEALTSALGLPPDRVTRIGAGYREDLFHARGAPAERPPAVAYVGKLSVAKGLPWLLDAFARLRAGAPELTLHIAGSGSGAEGEALLARVVAAPGVRYHGVLEQAGVAALLRNCRVLALPSFYEGLPLVLAEAVACGARAVATGLPGIRSELAPHLGGALSLVDQPPMVAVDTPDPAALPAFTDALADRLARAVSVPPSVPVRLDEFTWRAVFARVEAVWLRLCSR